MNVLFDYMYRDFDNWKMSGEVVFANPDDLPLDGAAQRIRLACCRENNFNARQVWIPEIYYEDTDVETEQTYHEFCGLEPTVKLVTDRRTLAQFIDDFEAISELGWLAQPLLDSLGYPLPVGRKTLDGVWLGVVPRAGRCTLASTGSRRVPPAARNRTAKSARPGSPNRPRA